MLFPQMPTFILFKNGQKVKEVVGANPPALEVCPRLALLHVSTAYIDIAASFSRLSYAMRRKPPPPHHRFDSDMSA